MDNLKYNSEYDSEYNEYVESYDDFDILGLNNILKYKIWKKYDAYIYNIQKDSQKDISIINKLRIWNCNRYLDDARKDEIKKFLDDENPIMLEPIHILMDNKFRGVVINGQHRLKAITELINEKPNYKIDIDICVIKLNKFEVIPDTPHSTIEEIFKIINQSYNIANSTYENNRKMEYIGIKIANLLCVKYPDNIIAKTTAKTTRHPRISMKELKDKLVETMIKMNLTQPNILLLQSHIDTFIKHVEITNKKFDMYNEKDIFGRNYIGKVKAEHLEKARKVCFYLNIDNDEKCVGNPINWIRECINKIIMV